MSEEGPVALHVHVYIYHSSLLVFHRLPVKQRGGSGEVAGFGRSDRGLPWTSVLLSGDRFLLSVGRAVPWEENSTLHGQMHV